MLSEAERRLSLVHETLGRLREYRETVFSDVAKGDDVDAFPTFADAVRTGALPMLNQLTEVVRVIEEYEGVTREPGNDRGGPA
jgi:hypothetical protein